MWLPLFGLLLGVALGLAFPFTFPPAYTRYVAVAILAALDSVFGALRGSVEEHFDPVIFITGFISNALFAAGLTYLGDRLGVEIYYAALFAFGVRIFQNLAAMRRHLVDHFRSRT
ncbi:MAG: small basic family protein [Firmicutes bacterium]|jgi:small basic protein|nr:small basic family protein [Bacillota bacterium]